jgi:hypothetical protein
MPSLRCLFAAVLLLVTWTRPSYGDAILTGTATLQGDGSYLYQYSLTNADLPKALMASLYIETSATDASNFTQSRLWTNSSSGPGIIGWNYNNPGNPALGPPGDPTAFFSFTSSAPPTMVAWHEPIMAIGPTTVSGGGGLVTGPGGSGGVVTDVPEPVSALLLVTGGSLLLLGRRRISARKATKG